MNQPSSNLLGTRRTIAWVARAVSYLVYAYVVVVQVILGLGFFLLLFGANPTSDFVRWVYRSLNRAMEPFRGIFEPIELGTAGNSEVASVFDTSVLFAMIIYALLAMLVGAFIRWLTYRLHRLDVEEAKLERDHERALTEEALYRQSQPLATTSVPPAATGGSVPPHGS